MLSNILPVDAIPLAALDLSKFVNGWTITLVFAFVLAAFGYAIYKFITKSPISGIISLVTAVIFLFVGFWMFSFVANDAAKAKQAGEALSNEVNFTVIQPGTLLNAVPRAYSPAHV